MASGAWLLAPGLLATFLGFANLENARRGQAFRPMTIFWSLAAGYVCYHNFLDLYHAGDLSALAGLGLVFCAVSPVVGWIWWGQNGEIRRRLFKAAAFVSLAAASLVLWSALVGAGVVAAGLALATAFLPFLSIRKRLERRRARWRAQRRARHQARMVELQVQRERQALMRDQQRTADLERELEAREQRIATLRSDEERRVSKLTLQRKEIAEQVRLLREEEVERVRRHGDGLRFHPHYGFLMAEAWRVLRAQIARGERIPAAEHDAFFYQVVDELLHPDDFRERYFHEKGRQAVTAVNRYLAGQEPLASVRDLLGHLKLGPALLAPEPLRDYEGKALLEAWLVPQRRHQSRLWENFRGGRHPAQEQVIQFLREREQGLPSEREWRDLWDNHPALFSGIILPPVRSEGTRSATSGDGVQRLWSVVSSIWKDARVR